MIPSSTTPLAPHAKAPPNILTSVPSSVLMSDSAPTSHSPTTISSSSSFSQNLPGRSGNGEPGRSEEGATPVAPRSAPPQTRPPRKLNRSANQLHRNQACLPCRRRRIKCDAARPHCSSCIRSFRFLARTQPNPERDSKGVQCAYEDSGEVEADDPELNLSSTTNDPRASVHRLEARIAELQGALARLTGPPGQFPRYGGYALPATAGIGFDAVHQGPPHSAHGHQPTGIRPGVTGGGPMFGAFHHVNDSGSSHIPLSVNSSSGRASTGLTSPLMQSGLDMSGLRQQGLDSIALGLHTDDMNVDESSLPSSIGTSGPVGTASEGMASAVRKVVDDDAGKVSGPFLDILWPGWPPRLPTPSLLNHLVHIFFNVVPSISCILHRRTFIARLDLLPSHSNFPHTALLHAICAVAARYTPAVHTISVEESIRRTNEEIRGNLPRPQGMSVDEEAATQECFGDRHAKLALLEMQIGHVTGRRMLEIAQAQVILAVYYHQHAKWIEGWMIVGAMGRLATALGLLNTSTATARTPSALLDGPTEDWDREERNLLMAYVMTLDVVCSTTSGWTSSLPLDEMMCRLPCAREDFERGTDVPENPQTWYSSDLYTSHPVTDSFVLYCKGVHLLGQVIKFKRKTAALDDPLTARDTPLFHKLDGDISAFLLSFPPDMRDPLRSPGDKAVDADLVGAHLMPHVAAIKLHETFADVSNPHDPSANRILAEARACLSLVYILTSTAVDFSLVLTANISSRTFILFYQRALESRDHNTAKVLLSEIEVFRMAFRTLGQRFAMGARHSGLIDQMLQSCHEELGESLEDFQKVVGADSNTFRDLAYPYSSRPENLLDPGPIRHGLVRESVVQPHHPLHVLVLRQGESLRDKMDVDRGFHSTTHSSNRSTSTPDRLHPPTPPVIMNDGGASWLEYLSPAATGGGRVATSSPDEMSEHRPMQVTPPKLPPQLPPQPPLPPPQHHQRSQSLTHQQYPKQHHGIHSQLQSQPLQQQQQQAPQQHQVQAQQHQRQQHSQPHPYQFHPYSFESHHPFTSHGHGAHSGSL